VQLREGLTHEFRRSVPRSILLLRDLPEVDIELRPHKEILRNPMSKVDETVELLVEIESGDLARITGDSLKRDGVLDAEILVGHYALLSSVLRQ
jgi:hypothetical protein